MRRLLSLKPNVRERPDATIDEFLEKVYHGGKGTWLALECVI